jgi:hypothetical protein
MNLLDLFDLPQEPTTRARRTSSSKIPANMFSISDNPENLEIREIVDIILNPRIKKTDLTVALEHSLINSVHELDVTVAYRSALQQRFPYAVINSPDHTDGFIKFVDGAVFILEFKFNKNTLGEFWSAVTQALIYVFRQRKKNIDPLVIIIATEKYCTFFNIKSIDNVFTLANWDVPGPASNPPQPLIELVSHNLIMPQQHKVGGSDFCFDKFLKTIIDYRKDTTPTIKVTSENMVRVYEDYFCGVVKESKKYVFSSIEKVDLFLKVLLHPEEILAHPDQDNMLAVPGYPKGVPIDFEAYNRFTYLIQQGYTSEERDSFMSQKDALVENLERRKQGAYFTPNEWVLEAADMVEKQIPAWKEKCLVWDPAAGTGNLIRNFTFNNLIVSTKEISDVDVIQRYNYNKNALVFQCDFLNTTESLFSNNLADLSEEVQNILKDAAEKNTRLVFFMNPPYGTARTDGSIIKEGIAKTERNTEMLKLKLNVACEQLYTQFMFTASQIIKRFGFKKYTVALFSVPAFMSSDGFRKFRDYWYPNFEYKAGMLFKASNFSNVSERWGISFTIWSEGSTINTDLPIIVKELKKEIIIEVQKKLIYTADDKEASSWVRPKQKDKGIDAPQMKTGFDIIQNNKRGALLAPDALGYFQNNANSIQSNGMYVSLYSSAYYNANGCSITNTNFLKVCGLFAARKLIPETWVNQKDVYLVPNENMAGYHEWNCNTVIYALLHPSNNCTALRDVEYKGKVYRIKNNFWWKSLKDSEILYRQYPCFIEDLKEEQQDSHLAFLLPEISPFLIPEANQCLEILDSLLQSSLTRRSRLIDSEYKLQLQAHDASIIQLKGIWKEQESEKWAALEELRKQLSEKLKPGIYEYGWLMK